jgi:hypothetical protein
MMSLLQVCEWIQNTPSSVWIRESALAFPVIEGSHLLAIGVSAGLIAISDLRMMGLAFRKVRVSEVFSGVAPWMAAGFAFMFLTGGLLFWSEPVRSFNSSFFRYKLLFLLIAGLNALIYHLTIERSQPAWDSNPSPPRATKFAGAFSLVVWAVIIVAGRTMAYNM